MNQEYTSIVHRGPITVPSSGNAIRLDPGTTLGRRNITITNTSTSDVFVSRLHDPTGALSGFTVGTQELPPEPTLVVVPTSASLLTSYTYRIPASSTLDDPCGDNICYFAAVTSGTATVIIQECF